MKYRDGYKYQVHETFTVKTGILPVHDIHTKYIELTVTGSLTITEGFAWDGASGPTWDTKNTITPSCVHDALYWLIRHGLLGLQWRNSADRLIRQMMIDRGMWRVRAWYWYRGLQVADGKHALPKNKKKILSAK